MIFDKNLLINFLHNNKFLKSENDILYVNSFDHNLQCNIKNVSPKFSYVVSLLSKKNKYIGFANLNPNEEYLFEHIYLDEIILIAYNKYELNNIEEDWISNFVKERVVKTGVKTVLETKFLSNNDFYYLDEIKVKQTNKNVYNGDEYCYNCNTKIQNLICCPICGELNMIYKKQKIIN